MRNLPSQRKTSRSKDENQQQTQPTYDADRVPESNPGHIGGRPAWEVNAQPLRHRSETIKIKETKPNC